MRTHQTLPQFAVIRHREMKQFVNDDIVPKFALQFQQLAVKVEMPIGRARCPFITHGAYPQPDNFDIKLCRPLVHAAFERLFA